MCVVTLQKGSRVFSVFQIYLIIKSLYSLPSSCGERVEQSRTKKKKKEHTMLRLAVNGLY